MSGEQSFRRACWRDGVKEVKCLCFSLSMVITECLYVACPGPVLIALQKCCVSRDKADEKRAITDFIVFLFVDVLASYFPCSLNNIYCADTFYEGHLDPSFLTLRGKTCLLLE